VAPPRPRRAGERGSRGEGMFKPKIDITKNIGFFAVPSFIIVSYIQNSHFNHGQHQEEMREKKLAREE
jgi:hypothetical protein